MASEKTAEAVKRLGAKLVECDHCGRQFAFQQPGHWINLFVDGELDWKAADRLCCSPECAEAFVAKKNSEFDEDAKSRGSVASRHAVYTPS